MATFLLVHAAWHGGWCWDRVASRLRARGHRVFTPTMTGLGERSHLLRPDLGLETHILDFVNVARWERLDRIVVCGHSLGGFVMTGVADQLADNVAALVYLDAFVPQNGQSPFDLSPPWRSQEILDAARLRGEGWRVPPEHIERWVDDPLDRAWLQQMTTPHPLRAMSEPVQLTGAIGRIAHRTYVLCENYRPSPFWQFYEKYSMDPGWRTERLPTLHDAMISMPDACAAMLERAAASANAL